MTVTDFCVYSLQAAAAGQDWTLHENLQGEDFKVTAPEECD